MDVLLRGSRVPGVPSRRGPLSALAFGLTLALLAAGAELAAPTGSTAVAWWPGAGLAVIAVATTACRRRHVVVGVVLVAGLLGHLASGLPPVVAAGFAIGMALEALLVGSWLTRSGPPRVRTMGELGEMLAAAACGAALVGGVAGFAVSLTDGVFLVRTWAYVAAAQLTAVLVVVPLAMRLPGQPEPVGVPERVALWTAVLATTGIVFGLGEGVPLTFLVVALLAWTGSRLGARTAAAQLVVVGLLAALLTHADLGPFAEVGRELRPAAGGAVLQLFLVSSALVVLVLAVSAAHRMAAIAELADQRQFDQAVLEVVNAGVLACDAQGTIVIRNAAHRRLTGVADGESVDPDELVGSLEVLMEDGTPVPPERTPLRRALAGEYVMDMPLTIGRVGSRPFEVTTVAREIRSDDGRLIGAVAACTDVTAEREVQDRLRESVAFRDAVLAASPDLIYTKDAGNGSLIWFSRNPADMFGHPAMVLSGDRIAKPFVHPDDLPRMRESDAAARILEDGAVLALRFRMQDRDGRYRWFARRITPFRRDADGRITELLGVVRDVTGSVEAEERLAASALHDPLTGLPNRRLLTERLDAALSASGGDTHVVVLFCDLDGFKHVNDTSGHAVGDAVLIAASARIGGVLRPEDTIARVGGDEFVVLLAAAEPGCPTDIVRERARAVARRVTGALTRPVEVDGAAYVVTVSVGVALGRAGDAPQDVLRDADSAMYRAKALGKDRHAVFDDVLRADVTERRHVQRVLRAALGPDTCGGTLSVAYQPMIDLGTQQLAGVEALARLTDGAGRTIAPDVFIPLAEDNGLIAPLGRGVLNTACADLAAWHARHPTRRGVGVSVNLSARQADLTDLPAEVREALDRTGLAATLLTVELTETVLVEAGHATLAALHALRAMGVRIAIDDFGTGYAGLRHLAQLPITGVKIDKSFTAGLPDDPTSVTIVRTIASLARDLDLSCVAEGIETDAQLLALPSGLVGQGWLLGRPVSADRIDVLLGDLSYGRPSAG
jgi:diguanylate cyclase (GGDEF)-like protein/PAS domain S-box-containing protein